MFKIADGREHFYQWDLDRQIIIEDTTIAEVHFCNKTDDCSLVVEVIDGLANVPNILLQNDFPIRVYAYCGDGYTKIEEIFKVKSRTKPSDYIYTETDVIDWKKEIEKLDNKIDALDEKIVSANAIESGSGNLSIQQYQDQEENVAEGYFDFTGKNPNATQIDATLTGEIPYGATGDFSASFNGRSAAQGFRALSEGESTVAKGDNSHAEGKNSVAIGKYSHAEGKQTVASAPASHAEGTLTIASNDQAHAEGYYSKANGKHSHAEGHATTAEGEDSHAEGINTKATAVAAHAEGQGTVAEGVDSHAEGYKTQATGKDAHAEGNQTVALGEVSHAEGTKTEANGKHSHAEGYYTKSTGENSHAEGWATKANGENSHAEGLTTEANGKASHSGGIGTKAQGEAQTVLGTYNIPDEESLLIVGCGISNTQRRNILRVTHDAVYVTKPDGTEVDILSLLLNIS